MTEDPDIRMTDDLDVVVRRSPRYGVFILAGIFLGFIVAGILVVLPVDTSALTADYSTGTAMAFLMLVLGLLGAGLGGGVALILDWTNARKVRTYTVRAEYVARSTPRNGSGGPEFSTNGDRAHDSATASTTDAASDGQAADTASEDPATGSEPGDPSTGTSATGTEPGRETDDPTASGDVKQ
ncbi:hypothetical protein [Brevibacterium yomogidense]|uniref:hypothetical protein n=1 Tax=Brevibacterium yomogidense TaxID=946573 RepID=UPI0018DF9D66|nr:hypothetical protein [Brevibacterium yomogidense]